MNKNTWISECEREIIRTPVMTVVERTCRSSESGRTAPFYVLKSNDWCNIIPVTEAGRVVMVRQYRIGVETHTLEIPGGVMDESDRSPQEAAVREMIEETGYGPLPGANCMSLGSVQPNPAILDNRSHFFLIGPVRKVADQKLDPNEMIETLEVPIEEIPRLIAQGEIAHSLMINAFFKALLTRSDEAAPILNGVLQRFSVQTG